MKVIPCTFFFIQAAWLIEIHLWGNGSTMFYRGLGFFYVLTLGRTAMCRDTLPAFRGVESVTAKSSWFGPGEEDTMRVWGKGMGKLVG